MTRQNTRFHASPTVRILIGLVAGALGGLLLVWLDPAMTSPYALSER